MSLNIYTNTLSNISQKNLGVSNNALSKSIERLSSGMRINRAADDASGMAISEKLRNQIDGLSRATMNAQDAISYLQTADAGLESIGDILQRMRELAVQAGSASYTTNDRRELQKEMDQLKMEIDRVATSTEFNKQKLLSGDTSAVWSASTDEINVLMTGQPVAEGNYRLNFAVAPGQNAVYKSSILLDKATYENEIEQVRNPFNGIAYETTNTIILESTEGYTIPKGMVFMNGTFNGNIKFNENNLAANELFDGYVSDADYNNGDIATITIIDGDGSNALLPGYGSNTGAYVQAYRSYPNGTKADSRGIDIMQDPFNVFDKDGNQVKTGTAVFSKNAGGTYDIVVYANGYAWKGEVASFSDGNKITLTCDEGGTSFWVDPYEDMANLLNDGSTVVVHFVPGKKNQPVPLIAGKWALIDYNDSDMTGNSTIQMGARQKLVFMPKVTDPSSGEDYYRLTGVDIGKDGTLQQYDMLISESGAGTVKLKANAEKYIPPMTTKSIKVEDQTNRNNLNAIEDNGTAGSAGVTELKVSGNANVAYGAKVNFVDTSTSLGTAALLKTYTTAGVNSYVNTLDETLISNVDSSVSGYLEINFNRNAMATDGSALNAEIAFVDALTGQRSSINITNDLFVGSQFDLDFKNGVKIQLDFKENTLEGLINAGDKMLFSITGSDVPQSADDTYAKTTLADGTVGPEVLINDGKLAGSATTLTAVSLTDDGNFIMANLHWKVDTGGLTGDEFTMPSAPDIRDDLLLGNIKLKDLAAFTDADGRMVLDNTRVITIYGNDREVDVAIEGSDTLKDLQEKLSKALAYDLGMGSDGVMPQDMAKLVTNFGTGNFAVMGTLVLQTATVGAQSELRFGGDEQLLNVLGFAQIQNARESDIHVTVTNAHTNALVGEDIVTDRMLRGIIGGVDVKIDSRVGINARFDQATGEMSFIADHTNVAYLHVANRKTDVQIGASEGIKLDISVARVDTKSLEIDGAYLMTREDSQKAITKLEQALERVTRVRSQIGAQVNRVENTMRNISIGSQNLIASRSRIKDLDVAEESATFAQNQVLINSAVAMLAQANQQPQTAMQLIGGR